MTREAVCAHGPAGGRRRRRCRCCARSWSGPASAPSPPSSSANPNTPTCANNSNLICPTMSLLVEERARGVHVLRTRASLIRPFKYLSKKLAINMLPLLARRERSDPPAASVRPHRPPAPLLPHLATASPPPPVPVFSSPLLATVHTNTREHYSYHGTTPIDLKDRPAYTLPMSHLMPSSMPSPVRALHALTLGPARYCWPRCGMPSNARNESQNACRRRRG